MTYSEATRKATIGEWRTLGFYYESDDSKRVWQFVGSKTGLNKLVQLLSSYASDPINCRKSEHQHYGPYMYFKVTTASQFRLGEDGIRGPTESIRTFAQQLAFAVTGAAPGDVIELDSQLLNESDYRLLLNVQDEGFDPASADPQIHS